MLRRKEPAFCQYRSPDKENSGMAVPTTSKLPPPWRNRIIPTLFSSGWFETWDGPIGYDIGERVIEVGGDVAFCHGLTHMTGTKTDGARVDLWFRSTVGLRRSAAGWQITHEHDSTPFYMDGSDRAAIDLRP
jgi:hypothetical protein